MGLNLKAAGSCLLGTGFAFVRTGGIYVEFGIRGLKSVCAGLRNCTVFALLAIAKVMF